MTIRVAHVVTGLNVGGAERVLCGLAVAARDHGIDSHVVCLSAPGPVSDELDAAGIPVTHLDMASAWSFPFRLGELRKLILGIDPDLVQGWMYHGNLATTLAMGNSALPVAWNVRQSLHRPDLFKVTTRLTIRANARYSKHADSIIYNSIVARRQHENIGFNPIVGIHIPNGVDILRFDDDVPDRRALRALLGIRPDEVAFIAVGRVHAIKGHDILLQAIDVVSRRNPVARFLVVGEGADWTAPPFAQYASNRHVSGVTTLLGRRDDVPALLAAADVFVSSSYTEGFPNAVAEAMASRLPCVVTDVGDSHALVGVHGTIVRPGNTTELADALLAMAALSDDERSDLGEASRTRIADEFSLDNVTGRYSRHYHELVERSRSGRTA